MTRRFPRRAFLRGAAGLAASAAAPGRLFAAERADMPGAADPKVVLIQYGGCVRPRETIASEQDPSTTLSPFLFHKLLPEGTTLTRARNSAHTGHTPGTLFLYTGAYDDYEDDLFQPPPKPVKELLPEAIRRQLGLPEDKVVVVHNEQLDSEFAWASEASSPQGQHRPGLLSIYRGRRLLLERDVAATRAQVEAGRLEPERLEQVERHMAEHLARCTRPEAMRYLEDGPEILGWWDRFLAHYEPPGARRREDLAPQGVWEELYSLYDRLLPQGDPGWTVMALRALQELRPRFLTVIYRDVDYVHWGLPYLYKRGIQRMDQGLWEIAQYLDRDPYYAGSTTLIVAPEAGRGTSPRKRLPFQHHMPDDPGSHEIFVYAKGPGIRQGVRADTACEVIDVAPTAAKVLGVELEGAEGRVLEELWT